MKKVQVIGAGQLGSRHLQAIKAIQEPLQITVVDPTPASLQVARERYEAASTGSTHTVRFEAEISTKNEPTDLAIVATNSGPRRKVVESLLKAGPVRYLLLEKTLFTRPDDFEPVGRMLKETGTQTFVNCCMRQMPIYREIQAAVGAEPFQFTVTGSQYGLVTNAIHYLDYMAWLAESSRYSLSTEMLDPKPIESKRKGYLELNGTLTAAFGSRGSGMIQCHQSGSLPIVVSISTPTQRWIVRESERKAWVSRERDSWKWSEVDAVIPYQSQMTTELAASLFAGRPCPLTPYSESAEIHRNLLDPLQAFLDRHGIKHSDPYPFT